MLLQFLFQYFSLLLTLSYLINFYTKPRTPIQAGAFSSVVGRRSMKHMETVNNLATLWNNQLWCHIKIFRNMTVLTRLMCQFVAWSKTVISADLYFDLRWVSLTHSSLWVSSLSPNRECWECFLWGPPKHSPAASLVAFFLSCDHIFPLPPNSRDNWLEDLCTCLVAGLKEKTNAKVWYCCPLERKHRFRGLTLTLTVVSLNQQQKTFWDSCGLLHSAIEVKMQFSQKDSIIQPRIKIYTMTCQMCLPHCSTDNMY